MKKISYQAVRDADYKGFLLEEGIEKIIQFGEGNFLRGFADYFIDILNEKKEFNGKVAVIQPIEKGRVEDLNEQQGLYTLYLRGMEQGRIKKEKRIISCISRGIDPYGNFDAFLDLAKDENIEYILSNTTEAGIVYDKNCRFEDRPPSSFPAKLTRLLYERFSHGSKKKGFIILSCELIDDNGKKLKDCVKKHSLQWGLGDLFIQWVEHDNFFCSTLVDRIVTGYPANLAMEETKRNGFEDKLMDAAEYFGLWVIEGPDCLEEKLPFSQAGLPVLLTEDHRPYKRRKVRILNGAHTCMVPIACLMGHKTVRESMEDETIHLFLKRLIYNEVIPTIKLPKKELEQFAQDVFERFQNPFIEHRLLDIALNSISKWNTRVKPSLKDYADQRGVLPPHLIFALAALIVFYNNQEIKDGKEVEGFFHNRALHKETSAFVEAFLKRTDFFQEDLTVIENLTETTAGFIRDIEEKGMKKALSDFLEVMER